MARSKVMETLHVRRQEHLQFLIKDLSALQVRLRSAQGKLTARCWGNILTLNTPATFERS
jgi:hypothetical protein